MMFMDAKVGNDRFQMQGRGGRKRAGTDMGLDTDIVSISHVTDLLALRNPPAGAQVRLDEGQRAVFKIGGVAPAGVNSLAAGNRDFNVFGDQLGYLGSRRGRFL